MNEKSKHDRSDLTDREARGLSTVRKLFAGTNEPFKVTIAGAEQAREARELTKGNLKHCTYECLECVFKLLVISSAEEAKLAELSAALGIQLEIRTSAKTLNALVKAFVTPSKFYASTIACALRYALAEGRSDLKTFIEEQGGIKQAATIYRALVPRQPTKNRKAAKRKESASRTKAPPSPVWTFDERFERCRDRLIKQARRNSTTIPVWISGWINKNELHLNLIQSKKIYDRYFRGLRQKQPESDELVDDDPLI